MLRSSWPTCGTLYRKRLGLAARSLSGAVTTYYSNMTAAATTASWLCAILHQCVGKEGLCAMQACITGSAIIAQQVAVTVEHARQHCAVRTNQFESTSAKYPCC